MGLKRVKKYIPILLCSSSFLLGDFTEDDAVKRINNHLLIKDFFSASREARQFLLQFPESKRMHYSYLQSLCEIGEEIEAFELWKKMKNKSLLPEEDRFLLEAIAWRVLEKAEMSSLLTIRLYTLLGAALTRDAKAIPIILEALRGSNALTRSLAVKLAASFGDAPLKDELARLLKEEKIWYVRLEVIQAVGFLKMYHLKSELKEIIANPKTLPETKIAAIYSLISMYDYISFKELNTLLNSNRAGLRQLACGIIAHLEKKDAIRDLLLLLQDSSPDVRIAALNTLGLLRINTVEEKPLFSFIRKCLYDPSPQVAITAGWLAVILHEKEGEAVLKQWIQQENPEWKRLSSAALSSCGAYGVSLSLEMLKEAKDPYVIANLSMGLISQRQHIDLASASLYRVLMENSNELWMWNQLGNPLFRSLAPSNARHIEQVPRYPQVIDQLVKLDILSLLSIVKFPQALQAVKEFLLNESWGVTGAAAATLLEEGDEEALNLVRQLLSDPEEKIKIQAALILALLGGDPSVVKILEEAYPKLEREMKIHILEALGHIGDKNSIPFLLEVLKEPFQGLRVVAASALIQCLYH